MISLFGRSLRRMCIPFAVKEDFHLAEFSLEGRLGCGSRPRCLLFFSVRQRVL